jgi:hypothetical protein
MDELVEVAFIGDEFQGSIIQALLEENGIRSLQQPMGPSGALLGNALLNPGGGPRRIMVYAHQAEEARALLAEAEAEAAAEDEGSSEPDAAT